MQHNDRILFKTVKAQCSTEAQFVRRPKIMCHWPEICCWILVIEVARKSELPTDNCSLLKASDTFKLISQYRTNIHLDKRSNDHIWSCDTAGAAWCNIIHLRKVQLFFLSNEMYLVVHVKKGSVSINKIFYQKYNRLRMRFKTTEGHRKIFHLHQQFLSYIQLFNSNHMAKSGPWNTSLK